MQQFWIFLLAFIWAGIPAHAFEPAPLKCSQPLFDGRKKYNEEISGIKCFSENEKQYSCYIIADEKKGLQQISISKTGPSTYDCQPGPVLAKKRGLSCLKGKKPERDFEAIASDGKQLFITGSWGNRRKKHLGKAPERWVFLRQKRTKTGRLTGNCQALKRKHLKSFIINTTPSLRPFIDKPLQCGGLNIEGLAYQNDRLFFGLRSPGLIYRGTGLIIEASARGIFTNQPQARLHKVKFSINGKPQKGIGIRALESLDDGQLLIATGPGGVSMENLSQKGRHRIATSCNSQAGSFYNNKVFSQPAALWLWTPAIGVAKYLGKISGAYQNHKLEGIAVLAHSKTRLDLVLTFDGVDNSNRSPLATLSIALD